MDRPSLKQRLQTLLTAAVFCSLPFALSAVTSREAIQVQFEREPSRPDPLERQSGFLWNGFKHNWERRVLGAFRVPHRISRFSSLIHSEHHEASEGEIHSRAEALLAQATGVDGDFMRPVIQYSVLTSPGIEVDRGTLQIAFADRVGRGEGQESAESHKAGLFQFRRPGLLPEGAETSALLQGFDLKTRCLTGHDLPDCNGNGVWPYQFSIELGSCSTRSLLESLETEFVCSYRIEISRAWTPRLGGLPPFEVKPQNIATQYELKVGLALLSGAPADLRVTHAEHGARQASAHRNLGLEPVRGTIQGAHDRLFPKAALGVHALRFGLIPKASSQEGDFHGRYIGGLTALATPLHYQPETGTLSFEWAQQILLPKTVIDAATDLSVGLSLIQLGREEAVVSAPRSAEGAICVDSSPQAPALSRWVQCTRLGLKPGQTAVSLPLSVQTPR